MQVHFGWIETTPNLWQILKNEDYPYNRGFNPLKVSSNGGVTKIVMKLVDN